MAKHTEEKTPGPGKKDLAQVEKGPTSLAPGSAVPRGMELVRPDNLTLPQILLVQKTSDAVTAAGCRPGDVVDSLSMEVLNGTHDNRKPLVFIPAVYFMRRVKWIPIEEGGGIDCDSRDAIEGTKYGKCAGCQHAKWGPRGVPNSKPACTLVHCFLGHVEGREIPAIMDLSRTKEKIASKLLSIMAFSKNPNLWDRKWGFSTKEEHYDAKITYFNYVFSPIQGEPSKEDKAFSEMLFKVYQGKVSQLDIQMDEEKVQPGASKEDLEQV